MKLSFEQIRDEILNFGAKPEYVQASIVMLRSIFKDAESQNKSDNTDSQKSLCDSCNMINCKIQRDWGVKAVECNEYM